MKTLLFFLSLTCIIGVIYGLYNEVSRPYVILFILFSWGIMLQEMKKAPIEKTKD